MVDLLHYKHDSRGGVASKRYSRWATGSVERHLDDDPLVRLVLQDAVCRIRLDLLSDGWGNGRDEGQRAEVQIVTKNLSEHLGRHQLLWKWTNNPILISASDAFKFYFLVPLSNCFDTKIYGAGRKWWWDVTVHIPGESISELLSLNLHV